MSGFDRTKYKATPVANLKQQEEDYAAKRPSRGNFNTLTIDVGKNKFRLMPCHPDGGGSSYAEARCVSWLSVTRPKKDDNGKPIEGETEVKRFPVFNSKVHGNLPKDLVEEYMSFAKDVAIPNFTQDPAVAEEIWKEIAGFYSKIASLNKKNGIKPNDSKAVYAMKWEKEQWSPIGQLEIGKSIQQQLIETAVKFNNEDYLTPDPYTSPDDGIAVIINNDPNAGFKRYTIEMESVREGMTTRFIPTPLTDEQLEAFSKLTPLYKMYVNSFKRSDFLMQIEGLQNFDAYLASIKYPLAILDYPDFLDIINELDAIVPDDEEQEEKPQQAATTATPPPPKTFMGALTAPKEPKLAIKPSLLTKRAVPEQQTIVTKTVSDAPKNAKLEAIKNKYKK